MQDRDRRRAVSALYCFAQILYWSSGFITIGYATAYLGSIGFSEGFIGLITAVGGLAGFLAALGFSVRIDKAGPGLLYRILGVVLASQLLLIVGLAFSQGDKTATALLYTVLLSFGHAMNSLFSKLYIDLKMRGIPIDFGFARGLGSLAYAGCSFLVGHSLQHYPQFYLHTLTWVLYLLLLIVTVLIGMINRRLPGEALPRPEKERSSGRLRMGCFFRSYAAFLVLVIGISAVSASNRTFSTYLVNLVIELGGDVRSFTTITGFLALIEIPVMLFFSRLRRKHSLSNMLLVSLLLYALKLGGAAAAHSLPILFAAITTQTFAAGIFHPASVEFVRENIPLKDTAKCQAILDGGPVFVSFVTILCFGNMLERVPARTVCLLLFLLALAGTLISKLAIKKIGTVSGKTDKKSNPTILP